MKSTERSARSERTRFSDALGRTIQVIRTDQGLSRTDLAKRAGISYSYLSAIENGTKPPSTKILTVIAEALGLKVHELLAATDARMEQAVSRDPEWERTRGAARALERGDRRRIERQARDYGYEIQSPTLHWLRERSARTAADREVYAELEQLLPQMSDEDVAFLLEMARKLARRG